MENALLVGLSRQMTLERQMDVVANNVANVNTTGFKADQSLFEEYLRSGAHEDNFMRSRPPRLLSCRTAAPSTTSRRARRADQEPARHRDRRQRLLRGADRRPANATPATAACRSTTRASSSPRAAIRCSAPAARSCSSRPTTTINVAADGTVTVLEGTGRTDSVRGKLRLVCFADAQKLVEGRRQPLLRRPGRRRRSPTPPRRCARASSRSRTSIRSTE